VKNEKSSGGAKTAATEATVPSIGTPVAAESTPAAVNADTCGGSEPDVHAGHHVDGRRRAGVAGAVGRHENRTVGVMRTHHEIPAGEVAQDRAREEDPEGERACGPGRAPGGRASSAIGTTAGRPSTSEERHGLYSLWDDRRALITPRLHERIHQPTKFSKLRPIANMRTMTVNIVEFKQWIIRIVGKMVGRVPVAHDLLSTYNTSTIPHSTISLLDSPQRLLTQGRPLKTLTMKRSVRKHEEWILSVSRKMSEPHRELRTDALSAQRALRRFTNQCHQNSYSIISMP
jgi:hypothetical protein